jgi:hypothetical protein
MATLNIQIINSSALNPSSRGKAERAVGQVKTLLKKLLSTATSNTLNWELLPFLVAKLMNHTVTPRTGFTPAQMIFGTDNMAKSFLDRDKILPVHHLVSNDQTKVQQLTQQLKEMSNSARDSLIQLRQESHKKINKTRLDKDFKTNDIVFVLDRYNIPGNTRPLKQKYHPSPWVVLKPYFTTVLIRRLADGFTTLYSKDDLKRYVKTDPIFSTLPPEVNKVLLHDFRDLLSEDFKILLEHDPLVIPKNTQLLDTIEPTHPDTKPIFTPVYEVKDEFLPEEDINNTMEFQQNEPKPDNDIEEEAEEAEIPHNETTERQKEGKSKDDTVNKAENDSDPLLEDLIPLQYQDNLPIIDEVEETEDLDF